MSKIPLHHTVTVRVPATTANLGPGFDCLGLALSLWNHVRIRWGGPPTVAIYGEGESHLARDPSNLVYRAAKRLLSEIGVEEPEMRIETWQDVPLSRGLGSSACAIVGGLVAANAMMGDPLPVPSILAVAAEMEGHPDNVAAALLGGCCISIRDEEHLHAAQIPIPEDLQCIVFIPESRMPTKQARELLGATVPREDAVFNIGRTGLLVTGLVTGHMEYMQLATQDRLHQPHRQRAFPPMKQLFAGALNAGASGVFLSGAGSSVVALTRKSEHRAMTIGYEMADAADKARLPGHFVILDPTLIGASVLDISDEV